MHPAIADFAVLLLVAAAAAVFGWIARAIVTRPLTAATDDDGPDESRRAREVLGQLHDLAARVAEDVGQHSHRVEAINEELNGAEAAGPEVVVKAIAKLVQANSQMQQKLASAEGKLEEQARQIRSQATAARTDALTGLANRRAFDEELARRYLDFQRHGPPFSIIMVDVDHFKRFNDTYGHQAGDEVLRSVAKILRQNSREADMVARYGGEEFAVVCPGASADSVKVRADRLRRAVASKSFSFGAEQVCVTVSMGIAQLRDGETGCALVERSDAAMYASKQAGRNCVHWHDGQAIHRIAQGNGANVPARPPETGRAKPDLSSAPPPDTADRPDSRAAKAETPSRATAEKPEVPAFSAAPFAPAPIEGLRHRTEFCIVLGRRVAEWRRSGRPVSVVLVQVDRFEQIASRLGPQAAQVALRATAQFLQAAVRPVDVVAQYDNNTFALLLPEIDASGAAPVAERLRQAIAHCKVPLGRESETITVSVGGTETMPGDDLQQLLNRAEEALDLARSTGGNRCCLPGATVGA